MRISDGSSDVCSSDLKARLASAMRCVSSRFFTALPRLFDASSNSPERRADIVFSLRERAAAISQRMASAWERSGRTSTGTRSEEHTSELQSLMRISYAVFCLKHKKQKKRKHTQARH